MHLPNSGEQFLLSPLARRLRTMSSTWNLMGIRGHTPASIAVLFPIWFKAWLGNRGVVCREPSRHAGSSLAVTQFMCFEWKSYSNVYCV